jgi:hypothetical protein
MKKLVRWIKWILTGNPRPVLVPVPVRNPDYRF